MFCQVRAMREFRHWWVHVQPRGRSIKIPPPYGCQHATTGEAGRHLTFSQRYCRRFQDLSSDAVSFGLVGSDVSNDASVSVIRVKPSWAANFRDVGKPITRPSPARRSTAPGPRQRRAEVAACRVPQETRHEDTCPVQVAEYLSARKCCTQKLDSGL